MISGTIIHPSGVNWFQSSHISIDIYIYTYVDKTYIHLCLDVRVCDIYIYTYVDKTYIHICGLDIYLYVDICVIIFGTIIHPFGSSYVVSKLTLIYLMVQS